MKLFVLMLILTLAGCDEQIRLDCTNAQVKDGWLHIAQQQIQIDKVAFVTSTHKFASERSTYRILIGVEGNTLYYLDNNKQACDDVLEKITKAKLGGKEL